MRKLPIGIQDFPSLRADGYLYVDKTELIYRLVEEGKLFFLSRPRRFGKSLTCSALAAYLEGKKELFEGLAIERLEHDWVAHPVLRLDLNAGDYRTVRGLEEILESHLVRWEAEYGPPIDESIPGRFRGVIERAHRAAGRRVAVIVDEYDKPLLATLEEGELNRAFRLLLKPFYGVFKSAEADLKLVFMTGVTKFAQVSIFSDLNQLFDLSMDRRYASLCGITEEELLATFGPEIDGLAERTGMSRDCTMGEVRRWYNGYRFHPEGPSVYNPFSTLHVFSAMELGDYWFRTGTPTFLVELLKRTDTDLREIDGVEVPASAFSDYRAEPDRPIPVIYQSGYLTIKRYDPALRLYTLGYPNDEVKLGFLAFLLPSYTAQPSDRGGFHIAMFTKDLAAADVDSFMERLKCFFEAIPYDLSDRTERHYQVVFYLVFKLLGQYIDSEVKSAKGRADAVVKTPDTTFVFEFKLDGSAEKALEQIDRKGYLIPFAAPPGDRGAGKAPIRLVKAGVEFDAAARNIGRWIVR